MSQLIQGSLMQRIINFVELVSETNTSFTKLLQNNRNSSSVVALEDERAWIFTMSRGRGRNIWIISKWRIKSSIFVKPDRRRRNISRTQVVRNKSSKHE